VNARIPAQALARVMVDELVRHGIENACLAPGSRSAPLALAFAEHPNIRLHIGLDERSVSFLAVGIAKATGKPVPILCTSGTAAANFHPAIVEAHHSRTPLIVFTADRPPELRDTGASQTIDQVKMYGDAVRWFSEVGVPATLPTSNSYWRSIVSHACAVAAGSPSGPVHLNVAFREPLVSSEEGEPFPFPLEGRRGGRPWTESRRGTLRLSDADVQTLADELAGVERGAFVAGAGEVSTITLAELADALGWPLLADPFSGARGPGSISTYDALLRSERVAKEMAPDVVVRIGAGLLSKPLAKLVASADEQILIDKDASFLDPGRSTHRIVAADPGLLIASLAGRLREEEHERSNFGGAWRELESKARVAMDAALDSIDPTSEPRVARDVAAAVPDGGTLVVASSMPLRDVESFMAPRKGLRLIANRGANGIDGFVSTALGVALSTAGPTVALCGDLSMLHDQNGLLLLGAENVDVTFVVVNNDGGGIFSFLPQASLPDHFEDLFGTPQGVSFSKLAELHGCSYVEIAEAEALGPEVAEAAGRPGASIIEVKTDRDANVAVHARLWDAVAEAVG
jgi:2-succinyl-5-enolpyruvyl-6-hydroxy-3-cyclohexene-1-carboxylate synthase